VPRPLPIRLLLLLAAACGRPPAASSTEPTAEPPQVSLRGVELQSYEAERLVLSGRAERMTYQRSEGQFTATDTVLRFPSPPGARPSPEGGTEVRAPLMEGSLSTRQLEASGGVVLRNPEGVVARAPRATYDAPAATVRGREGVAAHGQDYSLRADAFSLSLPEGTFTFEGSVETVVGGAQ
jgi:lipopolysaccharide export system protein LptC